MRSMEIAMGGRRGVMTGRTWDDQPAPVWPKDETPLPEVQLRPAPRPNEPREAKLRRLLYQSRCGSAVCASADRCGAC